MENEQIKEILIKEVKELEDYLIKTRRHIHMYPETAYEEEKTASFIESELQKIGYETERTAGTGVITTIKGKEGKTIALRADIDALNVTEENEVPYKSKIPGKMHACGHDCHTACLLTAAKVLYKYKDRLPGTVKLIFQPAEEGGAGAQKICQEGHLDDVDTVFGLHVWQGLEAGKIGLKKGGMMASADSFTISLKGLGGHAASPHLTIDPTAVLVDIYNALQKIVSREIDPLSKVVITSPNMQGSNAFNIIPEIAFLKGTVRTFDLEDREFIVKRMQELVEGYSKAWRCEGSVTFDEPFYPPVINDDAIVDQLSKLLSELGKVKMIKPTMGGEDFAFYLQKTKGAFIVLGIQNEEKGITYEHHHPKFDVDEAILWKGAVIYTLLGFYSLFTE
ncbi:MAG: amidohydrolase [Candidatus Heimdallarchaeota archaeon]|nr:amidohydrolase [Candidatus Heimdallarchaeota archaeon]